MDHRHSINPTQMSDMDRARIWNHQQHDHRLNLGSGPSMFPADNISFNGPNHVAYFNPTLRSNDLRMTNFSSEVPRYVTGNTGASHHCYMHLPPAGSISHLPPHPVHHGFPYNQHAMRDMRSNVNSLMDYDRATYKRKTPANFIVPDTENRNSYYCAGSSSNSSTSTDILEAKPIFDSHCWTREPVGFVHSYRSDNASSSGEGSQRNVRCRHADTIHLEDNISSGISSSSNISHHFHSIAITPGAEMGGQWNHAPVSVYPNSRGSSSGSFNHEINQSYAANHGSSNDMDIDGGYISSLPLLTGSSQQGQVVAPRSYSQGTYRSNLSYPSMSLATNFEDARLPRVESAVPPRYSTPPAIVRQSHERTGRTRSHHNRYHSFSAEETVRLRLIAEGAAMMDHSTFYDPDQHHGMRLDIDNMSYEELLALEERIGDVSTGLSEDALARCLTEIIYCISDQSMDDCEEDCCPICLEAYRDRDRLGRLNCKHIFHSSCVKKWLLIKNMCPICKTSALEEK